MPTNELEISEADLKEEDFSQEDLNNEDFDWKGKGQELKGIAKRRATQLAKAKEKMAAYESELAELKKANVFQDKNKQSDSVLLKTMEERFDKQALKIAGITDNDEIELAMKFRERTGMGMDEILSDEIFQAKLEKIKTDKANVKAAAGFKGGSDGANPKANPDYWKGKKEYPTPEEVPDRAERAKIIKQMIKNSKNQGRKFYND